MEDPRLAGLLLGRCAGEQRRLRPDWSRVALSRMGQRTAEAMQKWIFYSSLFPFHVSQVCDCNTAVPSTQKLLQCSSKEEVPARPQEPPSNHHIRAVFLIQSGSKECS
eukprot:scaffold1509_cov240-Pinguiococcus_pyrenoidosus.AAC.32